MIKVNTHEAKTRLSALLAEVEEKGEWVRICRNGRPIADLRPVSRVRDPFEQHPGLQGVVFNEDPVLPLQPEDWPDAFEAG
jgi:prevent-host-death family protein